MKCVVCGKKLERECPECPEHPPETDAWDGAGVHILVPGYGSRHDMSDLIVGICDDCIDAKIEDGSILVKQTLADKLGCGTMEAQCIKCGTASPVIPNTILGASAEYKCSRCNVIFYKPEGRQ